MRGKIASLVLSSAWSQAMEDGTRFRKNLLRRFSLESLAAYSRKNKQNIVKLLLSRGTIDAARDALSLLRPLERKLWAWRIREVQVGPQTPIVQSLEPLTGFNPSKVIYFVSNSYPYTNSGYSIRTHEVAKGMQEWGFEYEVVTRLGYPVSIGKIPESASESIENTHYTRLLPWWYSVCKKRRIEKSVELLTEEAREFGAELLHTTTDFHNAIIASRVAYELGIPWVYEVRGEAESTWLSQPAIDGSLRNESSDLYQQWRFKETEAAERAWKVYTLSEVSKADFVSRGVDSEKISVVPNSISSEIPKIRKSKSQLEKSLHLDSRVWVGAASALVGYEGFDVLIKALAYLPEEFGVLLVGAGTAKPDLIRLAKNLGLESRVKFAGKVPPSEVEQWYAVLDAFVVPRIDTPVCRRVTPVKPLLAMALEIPVVASDLPALREVTGGFANYFEPGDEVALADAVYHAVDNRFNTEVARDWVKTRSWSSATKAIKVDFSGGR